MAIVFLVRHAHIDNRSDHGARLLGWTDVPLSAPGREESQALCHVRWRPQPIAVYCSPLQRAVHTAEPLAMSHGWPLQQLPGLREIGCGVLDGQSVGDVQRRHAELWNLNLRQDDMDFRWPNGESYRDFRSRVDATLAYILGLHRNDAVVVVTHAGVISQWLGMLAGINPARWDFHRPGFASITTVWCDPTKASCEVLSFDDRSHLGGPAGRPLAFATAHRPAG